MAQIAPLQNTGGTRKSPTVTLAVIAYNQESLIREALSGALEQTYSPLEIIFSDDCSTDHTYTIMEAAARAYSGPHRIVLNRNSRNLGRNGIGAHINRIAELATGELLVFAAGDDVSIASRVSCLVDLWMRHGKPTGSIHSAAIEFTTDSVRGQVIEGRQDFGTQTIVSCLRSGSKGVIGATHAITANIFQLFGPLPPNTYFEDVTLAFRSLLAGSVLYCPTPLVLYRVSAAGLSNAAVYNDPIRWVRFHAGLVSSYRCFHYDYLTYVPAAARDAMVLKTIDQELNRTLKCRDLAGAGLWRRALAAYHFSRHARSKLHRALFVIGILDLKTKARCVWQALDHMCSSRPSQG
jgi:glycosyltransferase involved in cell wall biosynthesis